MNIDVSLANISYEVIGQGIPVLLIHGFSLDRQVMKGAYEPLFEQFDSFKRIYVDLPGMGESKEEKGLLGSHDILNSLLDFVDKVIGQDKFIVIGQSYGGYLAQGIVATIPERTLGLGLLCPLIIADSDYRDLPDHKMVLDDSAHITYTDQEVFEEFLEFAVVANQKTYDRFLSDILVGFEKATSEVLEVIRMENYALNPEPYKRMQAYDKPSLILVGKQDATVGYKDVFKLDGMLKNLSIHMINACGHALQYEQVESFNMISKNWLEKFI